MNNHPTYMKYYLQSLAILWICVATRGLSAQESHLDHVRALQVDAAENGTATWGHWGSRPDIYSEWGTHSNRLIPIYTHGIHRRNYMPSESVYRDADQLVDIYGYLPSKTVNEAATYIDQTQIHEMQTEAVRRGKKYIFLLIFDGMDRTTADAARAYLNEENRSGLEFFGKTPSRASTKYEMVTSPAYAKATVNVDDQTVTVDPQSKGGFFHELGGADVRGQDHLDYLTSRFESLKHAYTDSASSATSMMAGIKTYNGAINVTPAGGEVEPIGRSLQKKGFRTGVVTSVPISHATPAAAYAKNVSRNDYQDLSRDMLGLASVSRPDPLPGLDVVIGAGFGVDSEDDDRQGENFEPGNRYLANSDLTAVETRGFYEVVQRTNGKSGRVQLFNAAKAAVNDRKKLFGFFGTQYSHLPFRTADGNFDPVKGGAASRYDAEVYQKADIYENPSLAEMTTAAINVLSAHDSSFWLLVEAGDVDWANHDNNIDNSIGAVLSGLEAYQQITAWVTDNNAWRETAIIVTADHGHLLVINDFRVFHKQKE